MDKFNLGRCQAHKDNDFILFCLGGTCVLPLCKVCTKDHVNWHNSVGTTSQLETIETIRNNCYNDIHTLKVRFEEERAILHHFSSDGEGFDQRIHHKLEKVKQSLLQLITEYCNNLERMITEKMKAHKASHPGLRRDLQGRLDKSITELDNQEKGITQAKSMQPLIAVIMEEKHHDLEGMSNEIDATLQEYMKGMFDVFVHEDHINEIKNSLHHYVAVEQAHLEDEIEVYTRKLREGKKVYGMDKLGNNTVPVSRENPSSSKRPEQYSGKPVQPNSKSYESRIEKNNDKYFGTGQLQGQGSKYAQL